MNSTVQTNKDAMSPSNPNPITWGDGDNRSLVGKTRSLVSLNDMLKDWGIEWGLLGELTSL